MASLERVHDTRHHKGNFCGRVRSQWNRFFKAVAKARRERLAPQKHFIATWFEDTSGRITWGSYSFRIAVGQFVTGFGILVIIGKDVDQLNYEIRIRAAGRNEKLRLDIARHGEVFSQRLSLVSEHIRTRGGKALILSHEVARIVERNLLRVGDRIHRVADILVIWRATGRTRLN